MRILIVRNNSNSKAVDASLLLATYLATQGADYTLVDSSDLSCRGDTPTVLLRYQREGFYEHAAREFF